MALEGVTDTVLMPDFEGVLVICSVRRLRAGVSKMGLVSLRLGQKNRIIISSHRGAKVSSFSDKRTFDDVGAVCFVLLFINDCRLLHKAKANSRNLLL